MDRKTILIADSGSTKTDWALYAVGNGSQVQACQTPGINPVHQTPDVIRDILSQTATQLISHNVPDSIFFYGAGCTPDRSPALAQLLREQYPDALIEVQSDLLGAARALCGRQTGIACILGTGSNSCLYDGGRIVQNTPALGYILGDEGSGAVLGRQFINALFKNPDFSDLRDKFLSCQQLTMADIIQRVYREPMANRFLASTSLFIGQHLHSHPSLRQLVVDNFRLFFRNNIVPYQHPELPVQFIGSMACYYHAELQEAADKEGFTLGTVVQSPMQGLAVYHGVRSDE